MVSTSKKKRREFNIVLFRQNATPPPPLKKLNKAKLIIEKLDSLFSSFFFVHLFYILKGLSIIF